MLGPYNKKFLEKGMTLIEALVSTAIVAIGFIAIFQMVSYSVQAVDVSNERTKTGYLTSMVAEDLLADRYADFSGKKLYEHMVSNRPTTGDKNTWEMASCTDGSGAGNTASNVLAEKINKWDKRFSTRRIKCDTSNPGKKSLKIFDICSAVTCEYVNSDIHDKLYFGKMKVTIKSSGTDRDGNPRKKSKFLYFQIY